MNCFVLLPEQKHHPLIVLPSSFAYGCVVLRVGCPDDAAHFFFYPPRHPSVCAYWYVVVCASVSAGGLCLNQRTISGVHTPATCVFAVCSL